MALLNTDVVVVGAGPAGAVLAYLLTRSGVKVTLVEQNIDLNRTFRGPGFLPSSIKVFEELGLLDTIEKNHFGKITDLNIFKQGTRILEMDFSKFGENIYGLALSHGPLLQLFINECLRFPNFSYYGGYTGTKLLMDKGEVGGILVCRGAHHVPISSRLVVAADGRFSTVRQLAGIELEASQSSFDIVWMKLLLAKGENAELIVAAEKGGQSIVIPQGEREALLGMMIKKNTFTEVKERGIEAVRQLLKGMLPTVQKTIEDSLKSFEQLHYLDVKIACAKEWLKDGLALIGDAAHISSPVGSQGNNLAILDAVLIHPWIIKALEETSSFISASQLSGYEAHRRPQIAFIQKVQDTLYRLISSQNPIASWMQRNFLPTLSKTPMFRGIQRKLMFGFEDAPVAREYFQENHGTCYEPFEIVEILEETSDTKTFIFHIPPKNREAYKHEAGQFVTLRLIIEGNVYKRCYTLSDRRIGEATLSITVKKIQGGKISTYLYEEAKVGQYFLILKPQGHFILAKEALQHFMVAGGSGITPLFAMLQATLHADSESRVSLLYATHETESYIFKDTLEAYTKKYPDRFHFKLWARDQEGRRVKKEDIITWIQSEGLGAAYVCGPKGLKHNSVEALEECGIPSRQIYSETFSSSRSIVEEQQLFAEESEETTVTGASSEDGLPEKVTYIIEGHEYTSQPLEGESLLDTAIRNRLPVHYSCMSGICSTCKGKVLEGTVGFSERGILSDEDLSGNCVLTCRTIPKSKKVALNFDDI